MPGFHIIHCFWGKTCIFFPYPTPQSTDSYNMWIYEQRHSTILTWTVHSPGSTDTHSKFHGLSLTLCPYSVTLLCDLTQPNTCVPHTWSPIWPKKSPHYSTWLTSLVLSLQDHTISLSPFNAPYSLNHYIPFLTWLWNQKDFLTMLLHAIDPKVINDSWKRYCLLPIDSGIYPIVSCLDWFSICWK